MTGKHPTLLRIGAEPPQQGQKASDPSIFTAKFLQALLHFKSPKKHAQRMLQAFTELASRARFGPLHHHEMCLTWYV